VNQETLSPHVGQENVELAKGQIPPNKMPKTVHPAPNRVPVAMINLGVRRARYEKFNPQGSLFWPR